MIKVAPATIRRLARMRTRLDPFSEEEQSRLINWGWLMTDVAMRSYVTKTVPAPLTLPFPAFPLA